jgi:hypothetical protein
MDVVEDLRPHRKALVLAAERVATWMFAPGGVEMTRNGKPTLNKAQLNHLIGVCGEAECAEEIENYLRYQAGRKGTTGWTTPVTDKVITEAAGALAKLTEDRQRTEAWRLYAIFLTRAFTYQVARLGQRPAAGEQAAPRGQAPQPQRDQRGGRR